jgi:hypothetical protein
MGPIQKCAATATCEVTAHVAAVIPFARIMKWLRALLLLVTVLTNPVGGFAANVLFAPDCCGGAMCPMHRDPKSPHERPRQAHDSSQQTCMCGPSQQAHALLPQLSPEAILMAHPILFQPVITHEGPAFSTRTVLIRSGSPPDQPPRL